MFRYRGLPGGDSGYVVLPITQKEAGDRQVYVVANMFDEREITWRQHCFGVVKYNCCQRENRVVGPAQISFPNVGT